MLPANSPDRRAMLAGIVAVLAFPAVAGAEKLPGDGNIAGPESRPATPADYAALKFEPVGPELKEALGTLGEWLLKARDEYRIWQFVDGVLQKDDEQTLEIVRATDKEALCDMVAAFTQLREWYDASAQILLTAEIRTLGGLSRYALLTEETLV